MKEQFYEKKNNLFQSEDWKLFRQSLAEEMIGVGESFGIKIGLPFGKSFVWFQKGPRKVATGNFQAAKDVVFVRVEPESVPKNGKRVEANSLLGGQRSPRRTRVLDLTKTEEELLADMKPKTRYNIRLAEKKGVSVRQSNDVNDFYQMLTETSGRDKGYHPHEKAYYEKLMEELGPKGIAKIFICYFEEKPIAGILVTYYGSIATYLHGGFSDKYRNLMAPYLCQWSAIQDAKKSGAKLYDFWGVAETERSDDPWSGITRFKEGFGGEVVDFPGTFDLVVSPFWYNLFLIAAKIRKAVR